MRFLVTLLVLISTTLFCNPALAEQAKYRDARIFGKVVTQDIVFGTLLYRDNNGQYITKANRTYFKVQPLYERHRALLAENVGKTVAMHGRMNTSYDYFAPLFVYHDVIPVDEYEIKLQKVYYYSTIRNINQSYGTELSNEKALADLLDYLDTLANYKELDLSDKDTLAKLINFKDSLLRYQQLLGVNSTVAQLLRNRMSDSIIIEGFLGNNILLLEAGPSREEIIKFMDVAKEIPRPQTKEEGPMTVYGTLKYLNPQSEDAPMYEITGIVGFTLTDWIKNIKACAGPSETWKIYPNDNVSKLREYEVMGRRLWVTGNRWEEVDEEGNPTGRFYFAVKDIYSPQTIKAGLENYLGITNGELVF